MVEYGEPSRLKTPSPWFRVQGFEGLRSTWIGVLLCLVGLVNPMLRDTAPAKGEAVWDAFAWRTERCAAPSF